jgi:hypothetical protein
VPILEVIHPNQSGGERDILDLHDEVEDVTTAIAAEAVENLLFGMGKEGGIAFAM